jgi:hypothetical protein
MSFGKNCRVFFGDFPLPCENDRRGRLYLWLFVDVSGISRSNPLTTGVKKLTCDLLDKPPSNQRKIGRLWGYFMG